MIDLSGLKNFFLLHCMLLFLCAEVILHATVSMWPFHMQKCHTYAMWDPFIVWVHHAECLTNKLG